MGLSVIFLVLLFSLLYKAISLVKYWVTTLSGDGSEAMKFCRTLAQLTVDEDFISRSLNACHISTWSDSNEPQQRQPPE